MIDGIKQVVIANIDDSIYDKTTGDRQSKIQNAQSLALKVDLAGLYTKQLAQSEGFVVTISVEIPRVLYNSEKYCFFDDKLYEVKTYSKAKTPANMLLNVSEIKNERILECIKTWLRSEV